MAAASTTAFCNRSGLVLLVSSLACLSACRTAPATQAPSISADTWADIWLADKMGQEPPWNTPLGAFVGIHGTGAGGRKAKLRRVSDWTDGCIAVSDRDIDELYEMIPVGTVVEIRE